METDVAAPAAPPSRAGRNLPAAVGVGVALGAAVVVSLFTVKWLFLVLVVAAAVAGVGEVCRAMRTQQVRAPMVPAMVGALAMTVAAYNGGVEALTVAALLTVVATAVWRLGEGPVGYMRDTTAGIFVAMYVPFLAAFAALLLVPPDGPRRVVVLVATVVCSDVGGYAVGVLFGRHPMAPTVSPKKSWEGFAGSTAACAVGGALMVSLVLHGTWWQGVLFGLAVVAAATVGDLGESMLKRDLGIKDMGNVLPGHGGVMDRLDSMLVAAPVGWLLLSAFVAAPR